MPVLAEIDDLLATTDARIVIGVTGPPGSGKTTTAGSVVDRHRSRRGADTVGLLPMDGFHLSNTVLTQLNRRDRKGAPDTFDVDGFVALLARIRTADRDVYAPDFDHTMGEPIAAALIVPAAARLVVVEGNYLTLDDGSWAAVAGLLTRVYYVDTPAEIRRERLVRRHIAAGKSPDAARAWVTSVDDANARLSQSTRHLADAEIVGG